MKKLYSIALISFLLVSMIPLAFAEENTNTQEQREGSKERNGVSAVANRMLDKNAEELNKRLERVPGKIPDVINILREKRLRLQEMETKKVKELREKLHECKGDTQNDCQELRKETRDAVKHRM